MGLPIENYKGYVEADATQKAKNIDSDKLFLIHGLADSTAPYHHGVQLARALTDAGIIFRYTVSFCWESIEEILNIDLEFWWLGINQTSQ
jgi:dipeptidyl aminopeptidase/acylaminoacyl peptidase